MRKILYTLLLIIFIEGCSNQDIRDAVPFDIGEDAVAGSSCIDVCSDALSAGGFDPGTYTMFDGRGIEHKLISEIPNERYSDIVKRNTDETGYNRYFTSEITPSANSIRKYKSEADSRKKTQEEKDYRESKIQERRERFNLSDPTTKF